jgi:hypothetical protein
VGDGDGGDGLIGGCLEIKGLFGYSSEAFSILLGSFLVIDGGSFWDIDGGLFGYHSGALWILIGGLFLN